MERQKIEFVYFDLGNVLLSFDPTVACRNLVDRFGVDIGLVKSAVYDSGLQDRFEHGETTGEEFAERIRQCFGRTATEMPTDQILDGVSDMFTPIESMAAVLQSVRDRGFGVGLLSNTCHAHWDWICRQEYYLKDFAFDVTILSYEVGSMKPDDVIYRVAEVESGVAPSRLLFLDDKLENVAAAVERSWNAVQCMGGDEAHKALQSHRVLGPAV